MFCTKCGAKNEKSAEFCTECGASLKGKTVVSNNGQQKSKIAAGLLGIFLGCFGVHNFYLGYTGKAIAQLLLTLIGWIACLSGPAIAWIWGLIEGILILTGSINTDAEGNDLVD